MAVDGDPAAVRGGMALDAQTGWRAPSRGSTAVGIQLKSELGVGSTFTFTLPVRRGE